MGGVGGWGYVAVIVRAYDDYYYYEAKIIFSVIIKSVCNIAHTFTKNIHKRLTSIQRLMNT